MALPAKDRARFGPIYGDGLLPAGQGWAYRWKTLRSHGELGACWAEPAHYRSRLRKSKPVGGPNWLQGCYGSMALLKRLKGATILVVEDDALVQLELADWLTDLGLTVLTADNADQAIALLESNPQIDRLLTDVRMPGSMDGIRLAHFVARRWPPVKIIVLSGVLGTTLCELPADSLFVPKPYRPEVLWQALSQKRQRAA
jgi:CheY-like chemotaxis protein